MIDATPSIHSLAPTKPTKIHVVRDAVVIDGILVGIGQEKRFDSLDAINHFYTEYPRAKEILSDTKI